MSVPNKNRFGSGNCKDHRYRSGGGDVGPSGAGNDEEGGGRKEGEGEGDDNRKKGKKVSILGFRKVKRSVLRRKQKGNSNSVGPSRAAYGQCFLCLKPPRDMDSQTQSQSLFKDLYYWSRIPRHSKRSRYYSYIVIHTGHSLDCKLLFCYKTNFVLVFKQMET
ncbi:uncharacterized protein LOC116014581 [Ipomoea triloba]|uniref:uncharacterized protein LOC116014581 n=1 Tax=Ipomoea triloba TaxID=35885 RepID=UPI00125DFFEB|nr:uncharacterized protein LOC116014581 [Ipomoea triloba]